MSKNSNKHYHTAKNSAESFDLLLTVDKQDIDGPIDLTVWQPVHGATLAFRVDTSSFNAMSVEITTTGTAGTETISLWKSNSGLNPGSADATGTFDSGTNGSALVLLASVETRYVVIELGGLTAAGNILGVLVHLQR
jgi:hypothetical protein